mmetsp:Transcript_56147/g.149854  ORF Transcript_56147/g.149854 Transcript_56147/m.149854 type:complete len:251 (-) Transcript_56147:426-1178(-)
MHTPGTLKPKCRTHRHPRHLHGVWRLHLLSIPPQRHKVLDVTRTSRKGPRRLSGCHDSRSRGNCARSHLKLHMVFLEHHPYLILRRAKYSKHLRLGAWPQPLAAFSKHGDTEPITCQHKSRNEPLPQQNLQAPIRLVPLIHPTPRCTLVRSLSCSRNRGNRRTWELIPRATGSDPLHPPNSFFGVFQQHWQRTAADIGNCILHSTSGRIRNSRLLTPQAWRQPPKPPERLVRRAEAQSCLDAEIQEQVLR